jgi:hypothetical protein
MWTKLLAADGGTVQLQKTVGPFLVTVFSEPVPVRVGRADLSVLCQRLTDKSPVLDAHVLFHLRRPGGGEIVTYSLPARHSDAKNKLLYAASVNLPSPGLWQLGVDIEREHVLVSTYGTLKVLDKQPPLAIYWPYFVMLPLIVLLFSVNRWLRRRHLPREIGRKADN